VVIPIGCREVVECPLDPRPLPQGYRHEEGTHYDDGDYHLRERKPGCDVDVCFGGRIAVTKMRLLWRDRPGRITGGKFR
jgi:5'-nucleotidase